MKATLGKLAVEARVVGAWVARRVNDKSSVIRDRDCMAHSPWVPHERDRSVLHKAIRFQQVIRCRRDISFSPSAFRLSHSAFPLSLFPYRFSPQPRRTSSTPFGT